MMKAKRRLVAIGGGELRSFTTLEVDTFVRSLYTDEEKRPYALFVPTASHDSKPYFNTFRKTYTSKLGCKVDVALLTRNEMTIEHVIEKVEKADIIYVGGGDTAFLLETWKSTGFDKVMLRAYEEGKIICGLSAGAICWFRRAHSDYLIMEGKGEEYGIIDGLGVIEGVCVPHFDEESRRADVARVTALEPHGYAICSDSAIYFEDESPVRVIGECYEIKKGELKKMAPSQSSVDF